MKPIIIVAIVAALGIAAWYVYEDSQKSDLEKAADEVSDTMEDIADELEN